MYGGIYKLQSVIPVSQTENRMSKNMENEIDTAIQFEVLGLWTCASYDYWTGCAFQKNVGDYLKLKGAYVQPMKLLGNLTNIDSSA